jgi:hypothetical protein
MVMSMLDQLMVEVRCQRGHIDKIVVGRLEGRTSFPCDHCGVSIDLTSEPLATALREQRELASELDKKARQAGQIVKRAD